MLAYIAANLYPIAALIYPGRYTDENWNILTNVFV
jgi:hypothetical protein